MQCQHHIVLALWNGNGRQMMAPETFAKLVLGLYGKTFPATLARAFLQDALVEFAILMRFIQCTKAFLHPLWHSSQATCDWTIIITMEQRHEQKTQTGDRASICKSKLLKQCGLDLRLPLTITGMSCLHVADTWRLASAREESLFG